MSNQALIQFIDSKNNPTETLQVPLNISLEHLHQLIDEKPSLYVHGFPILKTLEETLQNFSYNLEEVIPIKFVSETYSQPALFCSSTMSGHEQGVLCVRLFKSVNKNVHRMVSGSGDATVRFWDTLTKTPYKIMKVHEHWVTALDCDDLHVVSGDMNGKIALFNWEGEFIKFFSGHSKGITKLILKENIYSIGRDGKVIVWNLDGNIIFSYQHDGCVDDLIVDDNFLITCGRDMKIKIYKENVFFKELKGHTKRINCIRKKDNLFVSCGDDYKVNVYKDFVKHKELLHKNVVSCVDISDNNLYIASASFDKTVKVWDAVTGNCLATYFHVSSVYKVFFKNNLVISAGKDKIIKSYCVKKKKVVGELYCGDEIFDLDYNEDTLVCGCRDKKIYFFK